MFPEYTASFVPYRQETVSKSNCLLAACPIAARTVLLLSSSIRPGVITSHLTAVNLGLARTQDFGESSAFLAFQIICNKPQFFCGLFLKVTLAIALLPERAKGEVFDCPCPGCLWVPVSFATAYLKQQKYRRQRLSCVKTKADVDLIPLHCVNLSTTGLLVGFQP